MNYLEFEIKTFKGIGHTKIDLRSPASTKAFSLIGLNESGKTTLLDAIYSFSPDPESQVLFSESNYISSTKDGLIPRGSLSDFTDTISVIAIVSIDPEEKKKIAEFARADDLRH